MKKLLMTKIGRLMDGFRKWRSIPERKNSLNAVRGAKF
jgi:hypothetical protein